MTTCKVCARSAKYICSTHNKGCYKTQVKKVSKKCSISIFTENKLSHT